MFKLRRQRGFTVVELLIVITVLGILATITVVAYNGVQNNAREAKIFADLRNVHELLNAYKAKRGTYPVTATNLNPNWGTTTARTDAECSVGTRSADWVPDLGVALPQSGGQGKGVGGWPGCYMYASDGTRYVLSAWNMLSEPKTDSHYRRVGFREMDPSHTYAMFYVCNHSYIGGYIGGTYDISQDYYKRSITYSNITACDETPPPGA